MSKTTSPSSLSPVQLQVAAALASGASISKAARACQVGRTTIHAWIKTVPSFAQTVRASSAEAAQELHDRFHDSAMDAIEAISALVNDTAAPPSIRLRAALAVLNRPTFPDKGWAVPYPLGTPTEIRQQEITNQLEADLKAMKLENEIREHIVAAAEAAALEENRTVRNNSEQKMQNSVPVPPPVTDPEAFRQRISDFVLAAQRSAAAGD